MDQFIAAYQNVLRRYTDFAGRTSVGGFWRFVAVNFVIVVVLNLLSTVTDIFLFVGLIYSLALIIPSLAVAFRRLHDTGKSGWFLLIGLIPIIGWIILIVFYVQPSDGSNQYGAGPED